MLRFTQAVFFLTISQKTLVVYEIDTIIPNQKKILEGQSDPCHNLKIKFLLQNRIYILKVSVFYGNVFYIKQYFNIRFLIFLSYTVFISYLHHQYRVETSDHKPENFLVITVNQLSNANLLLNTLSYQFLSFQKPYQENFVLNILQLIIFLDIGCYSKIS